MGYWSGREDQRPRVYEGVLAGLCGFGLGVGGAIILDAAGWKALALLSCTVGTGLWTVLILLLIGSRRRRSRERIVSRTR